MKVIIYNVSQLEKEQLALANLKRHQITTISNPLHDRNVRFAASKDVVIILRQVPILDLDLLKKMAHYDIRYVVSTSTGSFGADLSLIKESGIKHLRIKNTDAHSSALTIIKILDARKKSD